MGIKVWNLNMNDEGVRIRRAESVRMKRKGCWIYEEKQ